MNNNNSSFTQLGHNSHSHFIGLGFALGWQDVRETYLRSTFGPFWITIGLAVQITAIGLLFPILFGTDVSSYFPFLAISFLLWNFLVNTLNDSTMSYVHAERMIKQMWIPSYLPIVRTISKNVIVLGHNLVILPFVMIIFRVEITHFLLLSMVGLVVFVANLYWASTVLGTISARYRDLPPIVSSLLMVSFYVTPILWMPENIPSQFHFVLNLNPFFHFMELVRAPILGNSPGADSWIVGIGLAFFGSALAVLLARRVSWKIVYWL